MSFLKNIKYKQECIIYFLNTFMQSNIIYIDKQLS